MTSQQPICNNSETLSLKEIISSKENGLVNHISSKEKVNNKLKDGKTVLKKKKWKWRKNKKRTPKQVISKSCNSAKTTPTNLQVKRKRDENLDMLQVAIKKRKKKKMEVTAKGNTSENIVKFKPVLVIRKPEDYSANWKQLKEVKLKEQYSTLM